MTPDDCCNAGLNAPLHGGIAAVNDELGAGHERGFIGSEEQHHVSDFLRGPARFIGAIAAIASSCSCGRTSVIGVLITPG